MHQVRKKLDALKQQKEQQQPELDIADGVCNVCKTLAARQRFLQSCCEAGAIHRAFKSRRVLPQGLTGGSWSGKKRRNGNGKSGSAKSEIVE